MFLKHRLCISSFLLNFDTQRQLCCRQLTQPHNVFWNKMMKGREKKNKIHAYYIHTMLWGLLDDGINQKWGEKVEHIESYLHKNTTFKSLQLGLVQLTFLSRSLSLSKEKFYVAQIMSAKLAPMSLIFLFVVIICFPFRGSCSSFTSHSRQA